MQEFVSLTFLFYIYPIWVRTFLFPLHFLVELQDEIVATAKRIQIEVKIIFFIF
jgi:hypothetical protein